MSKTAPMNVVQKLKINRLVSSSHGKMTEKDDMIDLKVTKQTIFDDELPYCLKKKLFLFSPKLLKYKLRYVRCWRIVLDFKVTLLTRNNIRDGQVELIVDEIKGCSALEPGCNLSIKKSRVSEELLHERSLTEEQAIKKATIDARWKVVMGQYKRPPELKFVRCQEFVRPYYEAEVLFNNKVSTQWIAADGYDNYITYQ